MYTQKINNLRIVLKGIRERMRLLRFSMDALSEVAPGMDISDLERLNERYERLYAELTDRFTCLNIMNYQY